MSWKATPKARLISATKLDLTTGVFIACKMTDLRAGDVFKAYYEEQPVNPISREFLAEDNEAGVVHEDARKSDVEGYFFECTWGPYPDVLKHAAN